MIKTFEFDWSKAWDGSVREKFEDFYVFLCKTNNVYNFNSLNTSNKFVLAMFMDLPSFEPHIPDPNSGGYIGKLKGETTPNIVDVFSEPKDYKYISGLRLNFVPHLPNDELHLGSAIQWLDYAVVKMSNTPEL